MHTCYIKFSNFIKGHLFDNMNSQFLNNDMINYIEYDNLIDDILNELKLKLNWNPIATKYRVSEGSNKKTSNSTDAANFHRDINIFEGETTPDIYTLVIYLDEATLEIIPGSPTNFNYKTLQQPESIHFKPGDAILFNACSLHRGGFDKSVSSSRKCIQIFEIYKNKQDYFKYKNDILTIPGVLNTTNERLSQIWYNIPILNRYLKYKGSQVFVSYIQNDTTYKYISTESARPRVVQDIDKGNYYRMIMPTLDSKKNVEDFNKYIRNPFIHSIVMDIVITTTIIIIIILLNKNKNK